MAAANKRDLVLQPAAAAARRLHALVRRHALSHPERSPTRAATPVLALESPGDSTTLGHLMAFEDVPDRTCIRVRRSARPTPVTDMPSTTSVSPDGAPRQQAALVGINRAPEGYFAS